MDREKAREILPIIQAYAEEIANKKLCAERICYNHCNFNSPKHHRCGDWHKYYEIAKECMEFGYNKSNEWHKPSEKLPEECSLVLAYGFEDTEPSLYYFVDSDCWEWMPRRIASLSNDQVRKWKEIVFPKESE